jgi:hypothetical protein
MAKVTVEPRTGTIEVHAKRGATPVNTAADSAKLSFDEYMKEASSRLQYQMDLAQSLLRALTLGNGGAIIALLTFIGNTDAAVEPVNIWWAFLLYGAGLVGVFAAYIAGFFSQQYFYMSTLHEAWNEQATLAGQVGSYDHVGPFNKGNVALGVAIAAALVSLFGFVTASLFALAAIT